MPKGIDLNRATANNIKIRHGNISAENAANRDSDKVNNL